MDDDVITVVSGLPRSGTSLMMKMLQKGGLEPLADGIRKPDPDNPEGYFELEKVKKLPEDTSWLPDARGKVVKILAELIKHLPDTDRYRIVFMMRNIEEIVASQRKMLVRRGEDPDKVPDREMVELLRTYLRNLKLFISNHPNMRICYISYNDLIRDPEFSLEELNEFFHGELDTARMKDVIDHSLYRNRT
ncbi:MAG: sulfotransferase [Thermoplasmatota archaeon]